MLKLQGSVLEMPSMLHQLEPKWLQILGNALYLQPRSSQAINERPCVYLVLYFSGVYRRHHPIDDVYLLCGSMPIVTNTMAYYRTPCLIRLTCIHLTEAVWAQEFSKLSRTSLTHFSHGSRQALAYFPWMRKRF